MTGMMKMILTGFERDYVVAKKRHGRRSTPKRKNFNRKQRLASAKNWVSTYEGENIARAYRKYYGIDWMATFIELEILGIEIDSKYKESVMESIHGQAEAKRQERKQENMIEDELLFDQDYDFAYIAGYTSGGFPYGVTWEEMESSENHETEIDDAFD